MTFHSDAQNRDLEMTKLCAQAMGWVKTEKGDDFDPLHDDAQAMALVKKFELTIIRLYSQDDPTWLVSTPGWVNKFESKHSDLNRAIVECVAKMQAAK
jgi:hypothetical protein